jgi:spermidine/putrescine transport system permease protein
VSFLRKHRWLQAALLLGPAVLWLAAFVVTPTVITVLTSFWSVVFYRVAHVWQVGNYTVLFTNPLYYRTLLRTLVMAGTAGAIAATLSLPLAWVIAFKVRRHRTLLLGLVVMSLWIGYLLRIYGWRLLFGDQGVVNSLLQSIGLIQRPLHFLLFSNFAVIVALVHLSLPFAFVPIYLALERLPRELLEASADLGANRRRSTTYVVLPIIGYNIWAGTTFAFIISFGDYFAPLFVGAPNSSLIGNIAAAEFGPAINRPLGSAIGVLMVVVCLLALMIPRVAWRVISILRGLPRRAAMPELAPPIPGGGVASS